MTSTTTTSVSSAKGKSCAKKPVPKKKTTETTSASASATTTSTSTPNASLKRKRDEEIDRIKKKLKKMVASKTNKTRGGVEGGGGDVVTDGADTAGVDEPDADEDDESPIDPPPIPECIKAMMMSEPKLRNFQQIASVLHKELGEHDYRQVVDR